MSFLEINYFSRCMNFRTENRVFLPEYKRQRDLSCPVRQAYDSDIRFPVVYLLHGYTGDYTDWFTMIPVERYAEQYGFAIVVPHGYNSWYSNLPHGPKVSDYITDELPAAMEAMLPISSDPAKRFIAGLSMGGYGAAFNALKRPDKFHAFATASAVLNRGLLRQQFADSHEEDSDIIDRMDYCTLGNPEINELYLQLKQAGQPMPEHQCLYGTEDDMFPYQYCNFKSFAENNSLPVEFDCWSGGHNFEFWDPALRRMLAWFQKMTD